MSPYDERITTYFGDAVLRAGFMPVPHLLMRHYRELGLQTDHAMFVMQLMEITWDLAQAPTTMKKIADRMGVSVRTVQRYSEYLAARGLLVIYEQFEQGAQIENGYDLSPLFARLAALAPEPPLSGTPRERRRRGAAVATHAAPASTAPHVAAPPQPANRQPIAALRAPVGADIPPGDTGDTPRADTPVTRRDDTSDVPPPVAPISPTPSRVSRLKRIKNPPKNHQETNSDGCGGAHIEANQVLLDEQQPKPGGWSLRGQQPLTSSDITATKALLEQFGVHANVASAVAPTLAPAEAWSLGTYARAARLGPAWIAKQVFAFDTKQPRVSSLAPRYDEIGRQLASLSPTDGFQLLALIDRCCPTSPEDVLRDNVYRDAAPALQLVGRLLWALMNEVRHGHVPQLDAQRSGHAITSPLGAELGAESSTPSLALWQNVLDLLRPQVPRDEFETWFKQTCLVELNTDRAIIGTPNVFVREQVATHYLGLITEAIGKIVGNPIVADAVISCGTFPTG